MKKDNRKKGQQGEALAVKYLTRQKGHRILARNYHCPQGEIDIISKTGETLVFTEVKFRNSTRFGLPAKAVHYSKQQHIIQSAFRYLNEFGYDGQNLRFDVIEIVARDGKFWIRHDENAFYCHY